MEVTKEYMDALTQKELAELMNEVKDIANSEVANTVRLYLAQVNRILVISGGTKRDTFLKIEDGDPDDNGVVSLEETPFGVEAMFSWSNRYKPVTCAVGANKEGELINIYKNTRLTDMMRDGYSAKTAEGDDVYLPPFKYYEGTDFNVSVIHDKGFMDKKHMRKKYNTFRGWKVSPSNKYDISKIMGMIEKTMKPKDFKIAMQWFGSMLQKPEKQVLWALIATGDKGTGKDTLVKFMHFFLYGEYIYSTSDAEQLFGKFNEWLGTNLLANGAEMMWGGNGKLDSKIKEFITEKQMTVEKKFADSRTQKSYKRLFMTSNERWVVPASGDERRYYVYETIRGALTVDEWEWLHTELDDNQDAQKALLDYFLNVDLSDFSWVKAPDSEGIAKQAKETLRGVPHWVVEAIEDGEFYAGSSDMPLKGSLPKAQKGAKKKVLFPDHYRFNRSDLVNAYKKSTHVNDKMTSTKMVKELNEMFGGYVVKEVRTRNDKYLAFPNRLELKKLYKECHNIDIIINDDDDGKWA